MWYKLLYYLRMFRSTSYLVRSFITILGEMGSFILMYIIAVTAFSQAFYVVSNYHEKLIPGTLETPDGEDPKYYESYWHSWTAIWQTMLANVGAVDLNASPLAFIIHLLCLAIVYLTMLNILIASIGSSYETVSETHHENSMRELAELISDVRSFPLARYFTHDRAPEVFLFVVMHQEDKKEDKKEQTD
jgi:hypothetical protein